MEKILNGIKKINQVFIFILLGFAVVGMAFVVGEEIWRHARTRPGEVPLNTYSDAKTPADLVKPKVFLSVRTIRKVNNDILMSGIYEREKSRGVVYEHANSRQRNILFSSAKTGKHQLLFQDYKNTIISTEAFPAEENTKVLLCRYIKNYKEGEDFSEDAPSSSILLTKPDGTGTKTILNDLEAILETAYLDGEVAITYQKGGKVISSRYSTTDFKNTFEATIYDLKTISLEGE